MLKVLVIADVIGDFNTVNGKHRRILISITQTDANDIIKGYQEIHRHINVKKTIYIFWYTDTCKTFKMRKRVTFSDCENSY